MNLQIFYRYFPNPNDLLFTFAVKYPNEAMTTLTEIGLDKIEWNK